MILYSTILYSAVLYGEQLYCIFYCTVLYCTVLYCTVLYCTVLYCTVLEKLAFHIRMTDKGNIKLTSDLQKLNYLIRVKYKNDKTPWKMVTPIEIPEYIPKPELKLLKDDNKFNEEPQIVTEEQTTSQTPPRQNFWDHFLNFQPEGTESPQYNTEGTISNLLQHPKHTLSPDEQNIENKKKKIIPEDVEEIINDE